MRRLRAIASLVALVGALCLVSGCVSSSEEEAQTPTGAETITNVAVQTDESGATVPAPGTEDPPPAVTEEPGAGAGTDTAAPVGDVAAGDTFFAQSCSSCHMDGGRSGDGFGPQLAGQGLDADTVRETVINGRGAMPGGLATGDDLENVVAYVVSLQ